MAETKKNIPRKHHYVPQGYLRRFADTNERVWTLDFENRKSFLSSTENIASIRDYYAFENEDGQTDFSVELEMLQQIDDDAARIIGRIVGDKAIPTGSDWTALCVFIASLEVRTPRFRQGTWEVAQYQADVMAAFGVTPESFESFKKDHEAKTGQKVELTFEETKESLRPGNFIIDVPRTNDVKMMVDMIPILTDTIYKMTPHLLFASEKARFITCDSPIHKFDSHEQRRNSRIEGVGWQTTEVQVTVPLSAECCLVLDWTERASIRSSGDFTVANINTLRIDSTFQYLFNSDEHVVFLNNRQQIESGQENLLREFGDRKRFPVVGMTGGPIPSREPTKKPSR